MTDVDWTRSPTVALWTGIGVITAPILLWMVPWLLGEVAGGLAWLGLWLGLLLVPPASLAALGIGWRSRVDHPEGWPPRALAGMALGSIGLALAVLSLVGLWNLQDLENVQNLGNLSRLQDL